MVSERLAAKSTPAFSVLDLEPGRLVFSAIANITIYYWGAPAVASDIHRLARVTDPIYDRYPEGVSNIHIVASDVGMPSSEVRDLLAARLRSRAAQRACMGVVPTGSGFWASALRSFVTGLRLVTPRTFELSIFSSLDEVASWLPGPHFERTKVRVAEADLLAALQQTEALCLQER